MLAGSMLRDTANESRYDVGLLSSQCPYDVIPVWNLAFIIWLKLSLLDPSVSYFHNIIIK
ncbi:hypothetical protein [Wolbachia endosymbiont (group A) of Sphaerophoria taeniata]|uniref:hypothetical protein n=1 Tax=Wolbachia endosymbiont (group A) of Sphaerophoria taeniata TaxID=2954057 RepID=UPI0022263FD3|nr:hypothetical protein [Wolbachia endosymbiont (group A) of Sphaerophoria taeniata]